MEFTLRVFLGVLLIREGKVKKNKGKNFKGKPQAGKGKGKKAPQSPPPNKKEKVAKDDTCFECGVVGHRKKNYPKYLVELKNKKGFGKSRELKTYEMVLHVGNGSRDAVQGIGHFDLQLPSGLYLTLNNFVDDNIHSLLDGIFYFEARPINAIYELNLDDTSNNKSLYHVNTERLK
uniref:CCHC-type domain-containing protein n=1 Tax=Lactuca sativa TaxID=4236 RepID=A0A9R1XJE6_LACSA|nr:hypothetical protein LSAT_V11C300143630 [Lactuca sativa]